MAGIGLSIYIGNVAGAGSGLFACGSFGQKAAEIFTAVETISSATAAAKNINDGNAGVGDVLALLPAAGFAFGKLKSLAGEGFCFVAGTDVVLADEAIASAIIDTNLFAEEVSGPPPNWTCIVLAAATLPIAVAGYEWERRHKRAAAEADRRAKDRLFALESFDDELLSHGCGHLERSASVEGPVPLATGAEFQSLCDRLFSTPGEPATGFLWDRYETPEPEPIPFWGSRSAPAVLDMPAIRRKTNAQESLMPVSKTPPAKSSRSMCLLGRVGTFWLIAWLSLGGWLLGNGFGWGLAPRTARVAAVVSTPANSSRRTKPIEQIQVGDRVKAENPELSAADRDARDPDPGTWRQLTLRMVKPDGDQIDIELLRPDDWLAETGAQVSQSVDLDIAELGADGPADVLAIEACPPIKSGTGRVVTGTFAHSATNVIDVKIVGVEVPIGCTANHLFWSEDRQEFVPAGQLLPGERLRTDVGSTTRVVALSPRGSPERVYNLEVDTEHVYFVSSAGVLVHNACGVGRFTTGSFGVKGPGTELHHIATQYGDWGTRFEQLFATANRSINGKGNKVHLLNHFGPHSDAYHQAVFDALSSALFGVRGAKNRAAELEKELESLANKLLNGSLIPN